MYPSGGIANASRHRNAVDTVRNGGGIANAAEHYSANAAERNSANGGGQGFRRADGVLMDSFAAWQGLDSFRRTADRNKMYVFGDQWGDRINYGGRSMPERESIRLQGNVPITNNRLRSAMRTVLGIFQSNQTEPVCVARERDGQEKGEVMTSTLQYVYQHNKIWNLDVATLNNLLISGLAMFRSTFGWRNGKMDVWTDALNYSRVFFDGHIEDTRHRDCHLVGEIEDMSVYDAMARFSGGSRERAERIREIYSHVDAERVMTYAESYTRDTYGYRDFFVADDNSRCRVITTWRKEAKDRYLVHDTLTGDYYKVEVSDYVNLAGENERRMLEQAAAGVLPEDMKLLEYQWFVDNYWYFYHQAPDGTVLKEGESPFWHGEHPYSFRLYTFYDRQIFPFVSGFIDQQRYINRLITLQDFMMRAAAKGLLLVPESCIPTGTTPEQFAANWAKFNGVVVYEARPGVSPPTQVTANTTQLGVYEMLQMQLKMFEDISGIQGALQGQSPNSGTPAALYSLQMQNASTSLSEVFDVYRTLREERDMKNLKLVQQFYDAPKFINVSGDARRMVMYEPNKVRNTEFELSIVESTSSPVYRTVTNDMLANLLNNGHITVRELLENGSFPFADRLLQSIDVRERQAASALQMPPNMGAASALQMPPNSDMGGAAGRDTMRQLQPVPADIQREIASMASPMAGRMYDEIMQN